MRNLNSFPLQKSNHYNHRWLSNNEVLVDSVDLTPFGIDVYVQNFQGIRENNIHMVLTEWMTAQFQQHLRIISQTEPELAKFKYVVLSGSNNALMNTQDMYITTQYSGKAVFAGTIHDKNQTTQPLTLPIGQVQAIEKFMVLENEEAALLDWFQNSSLPGMGSNILQAKTFFLQDKTTSTNNNQNENDYLISGDTMILIGVSVAGFVVLVVTGVILLTVCCKNRGQKANNSNNNEFIDTTDADEDPEQPFSSSFSFSHAYNIDNAVFRNETDGDDDDSNRTPKTSHYASDPDMHSKEPVTDDDDEVDRDDDINGGGDARTPSCVFWMDKVPTEVADTGDNHIPQYDTSYVEPQSPVPPVSDCSDQDSVWTNSTDDIQSVDERNLSRSFFKDTRSVALPSTSRPKSDSPLLPFYQKWTQDQNSAAKRPPSSSNGLDDGDAGSKNHNYKQVRSLRDNPTGSKKSDHNTLQQQQQQQQQHSQDHDEPVSEESMAEE
jgi:hypothetical protein